jgi:hypothetical protein
VPLLNAREHLVATAIELMPDADFIPAGPERRRGAQESARCQYDFGPLSGTQSTALSLEPLAGEAGRIRFRLAPNNVAGVAAKIDGHLGTEDGLDLAPLARPTHRVRRPICRAPIVQRKRAGLEHLWHQGHGFCDEEGAIAIGSIPET